MESKVCTKCSNLLAISNFVKSKTTKSGYRGICKSCFNAYYQTRRKEKYELVRSYERKFHFERRLKHEYGMSKDDYTRLLQTTKGKCQICLLEKKLVIDHCHVSGKVRGMLCTNCNTALGHFKDKTTVLKNAITYLERAFNG